MRFRLFIVTFMLSIIPVIAQNTLKITVKDTLSSEPLIGVTAFIAQINKGAISNEQGEIYFDSLASGVFSLNISHVGYVSKAYTLDSK